MIVSILMFAYGFIILFGAIYAYMTLGRMDAIVFGPLSALIALVAASLTFQGKRSGRVIGFWNALVLGGYFTYQLHPTEAFIPWGILTLSSGVIVIVTLGISAWKRRPPSDDS